MSNQGRLITLAIIVLLALTIVGLQIWSTVRSTVQAERILKDLESLKLGSTQTQQLSNEKARQEIISLKIENERKAFFWNGLLATLGPTITAFVALVGAWLGLRNYLDARDKERLDRAAGDLNSVLEHLVSDQPRERAVGVVGLQHFLTPDKQDYHLRVLSALVTADRSEEDTEVLRGIRIAVEEAVKNLPEKVVVQVTWQGTKLKGVNLAGCLLRGIDFRDAELEDADLRGCNLSKALLTNAHLNGAKLDKSILLGADLTYADFAGASLVGADLQEAVLDHVKVMHMDLERADLRKARFDPDQVLWELVNNWRHAVYDPGLLERLLTRYGPAPKGTKVLMLMWEIPPLVAGGTWTACYHLVRNLRKRGADITVAVPWDQAFILPSPFGTEVEVLPLGIRPPQYAMSPYSPAGAQGVGWSPYGSTGPQAAWWSPYGSAMGPYSPYYHRVAWPYAGYFSGYSPSQDPAGQIGLRKGSVVLHLTEEFGRRVRRLLQQRSFDVIHAHDWVTFPAAEAVAAETGKPWVAHFHSTERDRRPTEPDSIIQQIEQRGARKANHIVAPSETTSRRVQELYAVAASKVTAVPNSLSREIIDPSEMGSFETKQAIFLGRLSLQKGPDLFLRISAEVSRQRESFFSIFGTGEEFSRLSSLISSLGLWSNVTLKGVVDWGVRGTAFSGASAVLVPSRSEPFGMVVLEAMQHRVPVLYPKTAGVAEVINSGIHISPEDIAGTATLLIRLLTDWSYWEEVVKEQSREIAGYPDKGYEIGIIDLWHQLHATNSSA